MEPCKKTILKTFLKTDLLTLQGPLFHPQIKFVKKPPLTDEFRRSDFKLPSKLIPLRNLLRDEKKKKWK